MFTSKEIEPDDYTYDTIIYYYSINTIAYRIYENTNGNISYDNMHSP